MKLKFSLIILLFLSFVSEAQKMPSDYFDEGVAFVEDKKLNEGKYCFKYIVDNHAKNWLYPRAFYNLGLIYSELNENDSAIWVFRSIIKSDFNEKEALGGGIMDDPYANFRHRAAIFMHIIYFDEKNYDSSLYYLALADTAYPYLHFCGNELSANRVYMSLRYAEVYEKMNDLEKAKKSLLGSIFITLSDNSAVVEKLVELMKKEEKKSKLRKELDNAIDNIFVKTDSSDGKEYSYYCLRYRGLDYYLTGYNKDNEKEGREDAIKEVKESLFYKEIND